MREKPMDISSGPCPLWCSRQGMCELVNGMQKVTFKRTSKHAGLCKSTSCWQPHSCLHVTMATRIKLPTRGPGAAAG